MAIHFNQTTTDFKFKNRSKIKLWIKNVIEKQGFKTGKIYFTFSNDEELLKINQQFLSHNTYNYIITFDYCEKNTINGEIYISIERVVENAQKEKDRLHKAKLTRLQEEEAYHARLVRQKEKETIKQWWANPNASSVTLSPSSTSLTLLSETIIPKLPGVTYIGLAGCPPIKSGDI
jgi:hypothetical protein